MTIVKKNDHRDMESDKRSKIFRKISSVGVGTGVQMVVKNVVTRPSSALRNMVICLVSQISSFSYVCFSAAKVTRKEVNHVQTVTVCKSFKPQFVNDISPLT